MIGYICKYTPVEIFEAMGEEVLRIDPNVTDFHQADTLMHPNVCSYAKGVLEVVLKEKPDALILTTCCDSIRRVYDVLKTRLPDLFIYILDIPRISREPGIVLYQQRIMEMIKAFEKHTGKQFHEEVLGEVLKRKLNALEQERALNRGKLNIGILGARTNQSIPSILEDRGAAVSFDLTCTGLQRKILYDPENIMGQYVRGLMTQFPCMRMEAASGRDELTEHYINEADGVIYHTIQFCDNYSYEYSLRRREVDKPMLHLETDNTQQSRGQILTRIEAFLESVRGGGAEGTDSCKEGWSDGDFLREEDGDMYVLGIDSGSTSTNAVIMNDKREIVAFEVIRTGAKSGDSAERILESVLDKAGLERKDISRIVSTGYGRVSIPYADENVTEISCHGRGAHYFNDEVRTILDIGGQDSKAIRLDRDGTVTDFVMNDKCAAGTGRFLEAIARTLEVDIKELGPIALESTEEIKITSMCTVFAESEVISLIANNREKSDIASGICDSIALRAVSLLKRVGMEKQIMMTGGVAKNPGVVKALEKLIGDKLYICPEPEIVGAAGAAVYALEQITRK